MKNNLKTNWLDFVNETTKSKLKTKVFLKLLTKSNPDLELKVKREYAKYNNLENN